MSQVKLAPARITADVPCVACPLRALPGFRSAPPDELGFIQSHRVAQLRLPAGTALITEGQPVERFHTLFEGWAFRFQSLPDGRRQVLSFLLPGDPIGLQANMEAAAGHGVETITPVVLCAFARSTISDICREHAGLSWDLAWLAAHGERLVDEQLVSVGQRSATERMAALLVHLFKRAQIAGLVHENTLVFPPRQALLADALGLSVVHVNRTLQQLRRRQLLSLERGVLRIGDLKALRRVAQYWESPPAQRPLL
jgi:CRP-like cAMP-binding protein